MRLSPTALLVTALLALFYLMSPGRPLRTRPLQHAPGPARAEGDIINDFHKWYYDNYNRTWINTHWLGVDVEKTPMDLWIFQELLYETKPDVLVECGTYKGGSAYFFASLFDLMNHGQVVTIDIKKFPGTPEHPRITYLLGSSTANETIEQVRSKIQQGSTVMVVLDSDHHKEHVLSELKLYAPLVTKGQYLVVEDTNLNGHPVRPDFGPGPMEALDEFLKSNSDFVSDTTREKFALTFNPRGFLKRVR